MENHDTYKDNDEQEETQDSYLWRCPFHVVTPYPNRRDAGKTDGDGVPNARYFYPDYFCGAWLHLFV